MDDDDDFSQYQKPRQAKPLEKLSQKENIDNDVRLTWLTNRIVLADTLHTSASGIVEAEKSMIRKMEDCQPYVLVNVMNDSMKLDGYAKMVHVPLGKSSKGGLHIHPTMLSLAPILAEYSLLTNDAAIVIFGSNDNVVITAAYCLILSKSVADVPRFMQDSLLTRYTSLPTTYRLFVESVTAVVRLFSLHEKPAVGINIARIIIEPGNVLVDGELYLAITSSLDKLKVFEFSAGRIRNSQGQLVFDLGGLQALDDVVMQIGQKGNTHALFTVRLNTQQLELEDNQLLFTASEIDVSKGVPRPIQDLRIMLNFTSRRHPSLLNFNFDRYRLLCVRNDNELEGYQKVYGNPRDDEDDEIVDNGRNNVDNGGHRVSNSTFFDTLNYEERSERLLDDDTTHPTTTSTTTTADLLGGFSFSDEPETRNNKDPFSLSDQKRSSPTETPILSAPTPQQSESNLLSSSSTYSTGNQKTSNGFEDLLDFGGPTTTSSSTTTTNGNFDDFFGAAPLTATTHQNPSPPQPTQQTAPQPFSNSDLLGGFAFTETPRVPPNSNVSSAGNSKPVSQVNSQSDFDAFLSRYPEPARSSPLMSGTASTAKPTAQRAQQPYKPAFADPTAGPKVANDAFSDLLNQGGFKPTKGNEKKSIGALLNAQQSKYLSPEEVKIRDWTQGKERNIRALLGSLHEVLWEGAGKWVQPSMGDLMTSDQIKKHYRKACLVVHPDKLNGSELEPLARAIFTELNDAYAKHNEESGL